MKKVIPLVLVLCAALAFTACKGDYAFTSVMEFSGDIMAAMIDMGKAQGTDTSGAAAQSRGGPPFGGAAGGGMMMPGSGNASPFGAAGGGMPPFGADADMDDESREQLERAFKALGGCTMTTEMTIAAETSMFSIKKLYARQGAQSVTRMTFENPFPDMFMDMLGAWYEEQAAAPLQPGTTAEVRMSDDLRTLEFITRYEEETMLFDGKDSDNADFDMSGLKTPDMSKSMGVKMKNGGIVIEMFKDIEGMSGTITIAKVKKN